MKRAAATLTAVTMVMLVLLSGSAHVAAFEILDGGEQLANIAAGVCPLTGIKPLTPSPKNRFCYHFASPTCCVPKTDIDMANAFGSMLDLGKGCIQTPTHPDPSYAPFREYLCMGCDPNYHLYFSNATTVPHYAQFNYNICSSFVDALWGKDGSKYDSCGLVYSEYIVNGGNEVNIQGSVMLGNPYNGPADLLYPSVHFGGDVMAFLNGDSSGFFFKPWGMDNVTFNVVDDSVTGHAACYSALTFNPADYASAATFLAPTLLSCLFLFAAFLVTLF